ncbi:MULTISPECIES: acyl carrier protein [Streptomyces]|jgi:minimal PKS acyl carrier protein|uniref:Putative polyketide synthase acyl carrier protein n=1 Tax=Streptomyces scabiei (strain 87.22) TaxID=680198 RepID=C9Z5P6_STRSW|nr:MULTISPECIES: acyl carrier protein [Streptomyces]MBP5862403.1 acyl carrier protein [Streptomyces sp. LBUM 1484]MBP5868656.1 acyl carrier protein [Streptomyces sp. LBUM 1485]MBP5907193.1 acyl carrier protein [Streptomyces sp. LBUM 1478]MBP5929946.1 acyl carrier protein [Streptomyces sp. LBUM 1479]KFG10337.1 Curamycin polyketide synthase acyl carrier protein [Streptomyces scabiei]
MSDRITVEELSELMKKAAGVTVTPEELQRRLESGFDVIGIDSLGLLGIVGELENRYGTPMPPDAEKSRSPRQFLDQVNTALMAGA